MLGDSLYRFYFFFEILLLDGLDCLENGTSVAKNVVVLFHWVTIL